MNRTGWLVMVGALVILSGCEGGSGAGPATKNGVTSRDLVEHPLDALGKGKAPKPLTAKEKAALEKVKLADPRGR
jgi:hypothetical protein